jgi:hypothetical protein
MFSTVQIALPVKPFDDQGQGDEQPYDQDAVGLMVADERFTRAFSSPWRLLRK